MPGAAEQQAVAPHNFDTLIEALTLTAGNRPELLQEEIELVVRE